MAVNSIQLGQVWRSEADGQDYLVTKVYNEVFSQFAMLRPAGITAPDAPTVRIPGRLILAITVRARISDTLNGSSQFAVLSKIPTFPGFN
jgi:hypothetical protein